MRFRDVEKCINYSIPNFTDKVIWNIGRIIKDKETGIDCECFVCRKKFRILADNITDIEPSELLCEQHRGEPVDMYLLKYHTDFIRTFLDKLQKQIEP